MRQKSTDAHAERLENLVRRGVLTADEAEVSKVQMARVSVISSDLPLRVRRILNDAVKDGKLGHMNQEGDKPEVYYHPSYEHLVNGIRNRKRTTNG